MMSEQITYPDYVWWVKPELLAGMSRPPLEDLIANGEMPEKAVRQHPHSRDRQN